MKTFHIKGLAELAHGYTLVTDSIEAHIVMEPTARRISRAYMHLQTNIMSSMLPLMPNVMGSFQQRTIGMNMAMLGSEYVYAGVGPMGQYLYHGKVMVNAKTDKGPGVIPGVGPRYRKGTELKVTSRDLDTSNGSNGHWVPFWYEEAKKRDLQAWVKGVQKDLEGR